MCQVERFGKAFGVARNVIYVFRFAELGKTQCEEWKFCRMFKAERRLALYIFVSYEQR